MRRSRLGFSLLVLTFSMLSAYVCALVFVAVQQFSLPRTDLAYGQSLGKALSDPFVVEIGGTIATIVGLAVFPVALFCLRRRDLVRCGVFVVGFTVLFMIGTTIVAPRLGLFGAPVVALGALLFCRFTPFEFFRLHGGFGDVA